MRRIRRKISSDRAGYRKMVNVLYLSILLILALGTIFYAYYYRDRTAGTSYQKIPSSAEFVVKRKETISVSRTPIDLSFKLFYPTELPDETSEHTGEIQHIEELITEPRPSKGGEQGSPLIWERDAFIGTETIEVTYHVKTKTVKWTIDSGRSGDIDDIDNETIRELYLGDEWAEDSDDDGMPEDKNRDGKPDSYKIEPSNPVISTKAREIAGNETDVYTVIYRIYRWMTRDDGFTYSLGREGTPAKATDTLISRRGDCDDQSILFISLLRSLGIPAWLEVGLLYDENQGTWFGHAWTDVYIPTTEGGHEVVAVDVVNEQFLFRTCNHMTDWTDDGVRGFRSGNKWVKSHLANYYYFFSYEYRSGRKPQVVHREEFITENYKADGIVLYDTETGESRSVGEIPFAGTMETLGLCLAVVICLYTTHRK